MNPYPATVAECLRPRATFKPGVLAALRALRRARPWRVEGEARLALLRPCAAALARCYGVPAPRLEFGGDCYAGGAIYLDPEVVSVLTFLHEFAHHLGRDERGACRWSLNLFRRVFPRSFARLVPVGHTLRRA